MRRFSLAAGTAISICAFALAGTTAQGAGSPSLPEVSTISERPVASAPARGAEAAVSRISRGGLADRLRSQLRSVGGSSGAWVYDMKASQRPLLFSSGAGRRLILASNSKLFTTAAALNRFGPAGRLMTAVTRIGKRRGPRNRILHGRIALVGGGDPALSSATFANRNNLPQTSIWPLARAIRRAGIRRITDGILVDPTIFDSRRSVPQYGITGDPELSTLSGLSWNAGFGPHGFARNPARLAGRALAGALRAEGIAVGSSIVEGRVPARARDNEPLGVVESPTLGALITATNKPSNNFYAEMLLKRLGRRGDRPATTAAGADRAENFAASLDSEVELRNGSGLSRRNVASPGSVGRLLVGIGRDRDLAAPFRTSLPIAGRDGTLADRMRGTAAEGDCYAKTGTINYVSALSGYCRTAGRWVAFSILMNGVDVAAAQRAQNAMVAAIARYSP